MNISIIKDELSNLASCYYYHSFIYFVLCLVAIKEFPHMNSLVQSTTGGTVSTQQLGIQIVALINTDDMPHVSGVTYPREEIKTRADAVVFLMDTICFIFHLVNTGNEKSDMAFVLMLPLVSALVVLQSWADCRGKSGQFQWSGHSN